MTTHEFSNQASQSERREVLRNDSYFSRQSNNVEDSGGRFAKLTPATITGSTSSPQYPQLPASSPWSSGFDQNLEPELGFSVEEMPAAANEIQASSALKPPEVHALPASVEDRVGEPVGIPPPTGSTIKRRSW